MVLSPKPVAQQFGKDDSLNVFISRIRRIDQFIQEGLSYHKANADHDNALAQMEVFSLLNDWSTELAKGSYSQGVLSLLEEIIEIVDNDSSTTLCLMNRIHRKYTEWCKSKNSPERPESLGSGSTGALGKSPRQRSPSRDDYKAIKKESMAISEVKDYVDNVDKQDPASDRAQSASSQSTPDSRSTAVLGKSLRKRSPSSDNFQEIKIHSMVISEVEDSVDIVEKQDSASDSAESSSSQSRPDSKSVAVLGNTPRKQSPSSDYSQAIKKHSMAISEVEESVDNKQVPATDSAESSNSQSTPGSESTAVLGNSPRKQSPSSDNSQAIKRQNMAVSEVEDSVDIVDKQGPASDNAESSSSQSRPDSESTADLGNSPRKRSPSPVEFQPIKRQNMAVPELEDSVDNVDKQVPATDSAVSYSSQSKFRVSPRFEVKFTAEDNKRLMQLLHGPIGQVIVYKFKIQVDRSDIRTLCGSNWLNDNVINFYMELLNERSQQHVGQLPSVYAMNSYFIKQLMSKGYLAVRRWTRNVDLFSKQIIPVPVHFNGQPSHWSMAIIDMRNKTIRFYDSLGLSNTPVLEALAAYLEKESVDKRHQPFDTSCFKIENVKGVPRQYNGNDCGVFCCMYAEYLTRNAPLSFAQGHMVALRKKMMLEIAGGKLWT